jgi:oligopeptidase B
MQFLRPSLMACACTAVLAACATSSSTVSTPEPTSTPVAAAAAPQPQPQPQLAPPVAQPRPFSVLSPNGARDDEYYWLRDDKREDKDVLAYLAAENAYKDAALAHAKPLKDQLYAEIVARIKQDDSSVPYRKDGYWYYTRYETGQEYPIHARRKGTMDSPEQVMLDVSAMARGHDFFKVDDMVVSPDARLVAWAEDAVGRRQYVLRVKNLATGEVLPDRIEDAEANIEWAADNRTFLYVEKDPVTLLGYRVRKHVLGTDPKLDPLVWEQADESFYTSVGKTKDDRYLLIATQSTVSSEYLYADAADPQLNFKVFLPRERDHEYQVEHFGDHWVVRSNWKAKNFRMVEVARGDEARRERWRDLVPHDPNGFVNGFDVFRDFLAVEERSGGLRKIRIHPWKGGADSYIAADEPSYATELGKNEEIDSDVVRYVYTSLTTPDTTYDYDVRTGQRTLLKREPVLGDFDPARYASEFVWATARDGTKVPVSLVYRRDTKLDGTAPMLQYGYGSYGLSMDPEFSSPLLSLLDRGFVYALAHIRGGQEMGRAWYEDGKLLKKMDTFTDFIDVTRWLVAHRYADPKRVFARGGSAGGLLMGAVANMAPQDYRGIVSLVPFVDVVTTMLDESIPLTTNEFDEWGNPKQKKYYDYMLSYSPYDNIERKDYPAMYVGTGLWDSQVQYYEPAKYVARLRARKTGSSLLVFRVNMEAGHGGKSGRMQRYEEVAEQWTFILDQASPAPGAPR